MTHKVLAIFENCNKDTKKDDFERYFDLKNQDIRKIPRR